MKDKLANGADPALRDEFIQFSNQATEKHRNTVKTQLDAKFI